MTTEKTKTEKGAAGKKPPRIWERDNTPPGMIDGKLNIVTDPDDPLGDEPDVEDDD